MKLQVVSGLRGDQDLKVDRVVGLFSIEHIFPVTDQAIFVAEDAIMLAQYDKCRDTDGVGGRGRLRRKVKHGVGRQKFRPDTVSLSRSSRAIT